MVQVLLVNCGRPVLVKLEHDKGRNRERLINPGKRMNNTLATSNRIQALHDQHDAVLFQSQRASLSSATVNETSYDGNSTRTQWVSLRSTRTDARQVLGLKRTELVPSERGKGGTFISYTRRIHQRAVPFVPAINERPRASQIAEDRGPALSLESLGSDFKRERSSSPLLALNFTSTHLLTHPTKALFGKRSPTQYAIMADPDWFYC